MGDILVPSAQLSNIPTPLINYIDSYLNNNLYFQQTCRAIYIASKSPQNIHKIDSGQIIKYVNYCHANNKIISINKFHRVNCLYFTKKGLKLWNDNGFIANNVRELSLDCYINPRNDSSEFQNEINTLISSNRVPLNTVNYLQLYMIGFLTDFSLSQIIEQMPNLQYLELYETEFHLITEQSKNIIQKLKGIFIDNIHPNELVNISNLCGTQLELLHVDEHLPVGLKKFVNIKELSIRLRGEMRLDETISTIKNFLKLKIIHVYFYEDLSQEAMVKFLNALFTINSLETVKFSVRCYNNYEKWTVLCRAIQQSLVTTDKSKLNLSIGIRRRRSFNTNENMHMDCLALVNALNLAVTNDFMFHLTIQTKCINNTYTNTMKKWLEQSKQKLHVEYNIDHYNIYFILCNKQSKINGYQEIKMHVFEGGSMI
eukprot:186756_1